MSRDAAAKPRAALTLAPTQSRISADGMVRTRIGDGLALNLTPDGKTSLTFAGARVDTVLGLKSQNQVEGDRKLGMSSTAWIVIGGVTVAAAGGFLLLLDSAQDNTD